MSSVEKPPLKGFVTSSIVPIIEDMSPIRRCHQEWCNPKIGKLIESAGYRRGEPKPLTKLPPNLIGEKIHRLMPTQHKLLKEGHRVPSSCWGIGLTPKPPVKLLGKKVVINHITVL